MGERKIVIRYRTMRFGVLIGALVIALHAGPARASDAAVEGGVGTASVLASLIYGPIKLAYSTLGVVFGGLAYGLSGGDSDVLTAVITPAVRGDYVITPDHIRGERSIEFFGRQPEYRDEEVVLEEVY